MKQYRAHLLVCAGTGCVSCGSFKIKEALEKEIKTRGLQEEVQVVATGCNGFCERGPIVLVQPDGVFYQLLTVDDVPHLVEEHLLKGRPVKKLMYVPPAEKQPVPKMKDIEFFKHQRLIVLRNRGRIDPEKIEEYIAFDGYEAMAKALTGMTPQEIIDEILFSGLRGRGGAGFPTGKKWAAAAKEKATPKYLICNGDEGDPGAFMDRSVLEADPHAVLEGMVIGAKAIGASKGFVYIRHEYPLALKRMEIAIAQARDNGLLGQDILGSGFDFDLEIVQGAGAFVSGEESALIASVEGRIAMPRQRPPYPAQKGLWGKHGHQQRRDLGHGPQHHPPRRGLVPGAGDRDEQGDQDLRPGRQDRQHRPGRGPDGDHPPRDRLRHRRRHPRQAGLQGHPDRRPLGRLPAGQDARPARRLREPDRGRGHDGLGRHDRHGRQDLHGRR
ncbi:MAG: nuoF, partial [Candidatus Aminicenantes bacterium]|nr:nuoF [Candidatus Aminicenantes bacterium]